MKVGCEECNIWWYVETSGVKCPMCSLRTRLSLAEKVIYTAEGLLNIKGIIPAPLTPELVSFRSLLATFRAYDAGKGGGVMLKEEKNKFIGKYGPRGTIRSNGTAIVRDLNRVIRAVREECEKVAHGNRGDSRRQYGTGWNDACDAIADEIRGKNRK